MAEKKRRLIECLPLCDSCCRKLLIKSLWLFLLLYPFYQYYLVQFQFKQWDLLLFSGVGALILGLRLVAEVPDRFRDMIIRLESRQLLEFDSLSSENLLAQINEKGDILARLIGLFVALAIIAAFTFVLSKNFTLQMTLLGFAEMTAGYVAGNVLGRMVSYGQLGWHLKKKGLFVKVVPYHVDGVGGLKPVGDYYFFQAMLVAIPAIFLAVWWFLFPIWPKDYSYWESPYLVLMCLALSLEIAAFFIPLWSFHRIMVKQKEEWQEVADKLSKEITELQDLLLSDKSEDQKKLAKGRIQEKTECYRAIENMVTWPVDAGTRKKFRLNNFLLFIPILGDIAKRNIPWEKVYDILKNFTA